MVSRKDRRNSGRKVSKFYNPEQGQYYQEYWDDWNDYRDSFRPGGYPDNDRTIIKRKQESNNLKQPTIMSRKLYFDDETTFIVNDSFKKIHENNKKLQKLLLRRKLMKNKRKR